MSLSLCEGHIKHDYRANTDPQALYTQSSTHKKSLEIQRQYMDKDVFDNIIFFKL